MKDANVFVLRNKNGDVLSPAIQASVLAKYSRSPDTATELLERMTEEDAQAFQEKWGVTYGHSSVAELVTLPYCFEGVSIIASKFLERYQRAAYSEKSTRYQVFSRDSFVMPKTRSGTPSHEGIREAANILYDAYVKMTGPFTEFITEKMRGSDGVLPKKSVIEARAFDSLRYLLPAGTGTNLGAVLNARDARYMMNHLLGSQYTELRELGEKMQLAARAVAPVFAMGVKADDFSSDLWNVYDLSTDVFYKKDGNQHPDVEMSLMTHEAVTEFYPRAKAWYGMPTKSHGRDILGSYMDRRGNRPVPDIFKTVHVEFDILMDYGAFRDLQRHRRCDQFVENLTHEYGYVVPHDIRGTEFELDFKKAMDDNRDLISRVLKQDVSKDETQYALPLGTLHRSKFLMDLKELYYIIELRTQPQGHISYREIVYKMFERAKYQLPDLMQWCRAIKPDTIGAHT